MKNFWIACRTKSVSTLTRPATSKTATPCGPGASAPSCTRCSRSTRRERREVLIKVLGTEFDGVLGCDYFSSYRS